MGIALWHFVVWLPDHFWGGIVGSFVVATIGAAVGGFLLNGLQVPGRDETELIQAFLGVPGAVVALAASYWYGKRKESEQSSV